MFNSLSLSAIGLGSIRTQQVVEESTR